MTTDQEGETRRPEGNRKRADTVDSRHYSEQSTSRAAFFASFRYAFAGLAYTFRTQRNFRIHIAIAILAALLGLVLGLSWVEWAVVVVLVVVVLSAEMVNTMVEALVDLVTPEYHPLAKVAKDVAAGVVLLSAIGAVLVGVLIFLPKIVALLLK